MRSAEQAIHEAVVKHLEWRAMPGIAWWHTASGEARNPIVGAKLKRMGVKKGIPDIIGLIPFDGHMTFFALELKSAQGRLSKEQRAFLDLVADNGGLSAWAASIDDALSHLAAWGVIPPLEFKAERV